MDIDPAQARQRIAAGHGMRDDERRLEQLRQRAARHQPDPALDRVLTLQAEDPETFRFLSAHVRTAAGFYAQGRQAAADLAALEASEGTDR